MNTNKVLKDLINSTIYDDFDFKEEMLDKIIYHIVENAMREVQADDKKLEIPELEYSDMYVEDVQCRIENINGNDLDKKIAFSFQLCWGHGETIDPHWIYSEIGERVEKFLNEIGVNA